MMLAVLRAWTPRRVRTYKLNAHLDEDNVSELVVELLLTSKFEEGCGSPNMRIPGMVLLPIFAGYCLITYQLV